MRFQGFRFALSCLMLCAASGAPAAFARTAPAALDPVSSPAWAADMARFAEEDAATPPPAHPIVFTGSSSIRLWTTLAEDFPGKPVLNRGFGGSQVRDAVHYADQVALRYRPRAIVLYAGDNDIDAGRTPEQVRADVRAFVARVRRDLPDVPIVYLAIEFQARCDELFDQLESGSLDRITVTQDGRAVAELRPPSNAAAEAVNR